MSTGSRHRRNQISMQFTARPIPMLKSPAYRVLSLAAHRALARIEIEHASHGGAENGHLPITYDDFEEYGMDRGSIAPALRELVALGFIEITARGYAGKTEGQPNKFRLTYRHAKGDGGDGTHEWRKIKDIAEAAVIAKRARAEIDQHNISIRRKHFASREIPPRPVGKFPTGPEKSPVGKSPTMGPVGNSPLLSISREGRVVGGRTAASLSGQASGEGVRMSAPDGSSMSPSPSPDAPFSSIPSPQSAALTVASTSTNSPARRARLPPDYDQLELFAAPPPPCLGTPRDRCIAAVVQWHFDPAMAAATVDRGIAAGGIEEVARLIGEANSTDGRRNHARRWAWFRNRVAKLASRAEVERVASSVGSASANDAGASAHNAVIEIGGWKIIVGQLVRWGLSAEAAGPLATSLIRTLGGSRQTVDYVQSVVRRRRSGKASVATIERCISSPNSNSRRRVRRDDHAKQPQSH